MRADLLKQYSEYSLGHGGRGNEDGGFYVLEFRWSRHCSVCILVSILYIQKTNPKCKKFVKASSNKINPL